MEVESLFHMHLIHAHKFMVKLFIFNAHYCHGHERSWMVTSSQSDKTFGLFHGTKLERWPWGTLSNMKKVQQHLYIYKIY